VSPIPGRPICQAIETHRKVCGFGSKPTSSHRYCTFTDPPDSESKKLAISFVMDFTELNLVKPLARELRNSSDPLLRSVKQVEKRTFPAAETFDFDSELAKRTTHFYCALKGGIGDSKNLELYGYIVFVRSRLITRIHKVCVVEEQRGKGVGKWMMDLVLAELRKGGAEKVDLWVDTGREAARRLYLSCGFEDRETVNDYYSAGRHGIRMEVTLAN